MKRAKQTILVLLSMVMFLSALLGTPTNVQAEEQEPQEEYLQENIALNPGFYCLHPHKWTPMPSDPVLMTATPSTEYTGYSQETLDKVAAASILRGDYYRATGTYIDEGTLQSVIWATVCNDPECLKTGSNIHLNGRPEAEAYYNYVSENYDEVIGKYTMTIWVSTIDEYQDILEVKLIEKHSVPSVEKKVWDKNDSESKELDADGWQDSADYDIGDSIPFRLTAFLRDMTGFKEYYLEFVDQMTHLTFKPGSLKVMIDGVDKTEYFTVTWKPEAKELNILCENVLAIGAKNDSIVTVTYNATLDEDAEIVVGESDWYRQFVGNPNEVYLVYSRSTGVSDRGMTPKDKVTVFTYRTVINKVDEKGVALTGAAFELFKWVADDSEEGGSYVSLGVRGAVKNSNGSYTLTDDHNTIFEWRGIDDGRYKFVEVVTPVGYNAITPIEFTLSAFHDRMSEDPELQYLSSDYCFSKDWYDMEVVGWGALIEHGEIIPKIDLDENGNMIHYYTDKEGNIIPMDTYFHYTNSIITTVENRKGAILPETGGTGTTVIYTAGILMMVSAVAVLLWKKRQV